MARGYSNLGICASLYLAPKTLETHIQHVLSKLDLRPTPLYHRRVCAVLAWNEETNVTDVTEGSGLAPMWVA